MISRACPAAQDAPGQSPYAAERIQAAYRNFELHDTLFRVFNLRIGFRAVQNPYNRNILRVCNAYTGAIRKRGGILRWYLNERFKRLRSSHVHSLMDVLRLNKSPL